MPVCLGAYCMAMEIGPSSSGPWTKATSPSGGTYYYEERGEMDGGGYYLGYRDVFKFSDLRPDTEYYLKVYGESYSGLHDEYIEKARTKAPEKTVENTLKVGDIVMLDVDGQDNPVPCVCIYDKEYNETHGTNYRCTGLRYYLCGG